MLSLVMIKMLIIISFGMSYFIPTEIIRKVFITILILFSVCFGGYLSINIYKYLDKEIK